MRGATRDVRFGPKADSCTAAILSLFDRLVGVGEEGRRYFQANCFRSPEVDHKLTSLVSDRADALVVAPDTFLPARANCHPVSTPLDPRNLYGT